MTDIKVISLGGSIISPDKVDDKFLINFSTLIRSYLSKDSHKKLIFVCGGGAPAREYQRAYTAAVVSPDPVRADWIGIAATKLNAELVRHLFAEFCLDPVVTDPSGDFGFTGRVLAASGWKPGFSTDYDAVLLAERFKARTVVNLSNIAQAYTDDPKKNPSARPIADITWKEFRIIVGDVWEPGKNTPFDPLASRLAAELKLTVIIAAGRDLNNLQNILDDKPFHGTFIHP